MSEPSEAAVPSTAESRMDVAETCTRMAVHADRREWAALRGLFADEVPVVMSATWGDGNRDLAARAAG